MIAHRCLDLMSELGVTTSHIRLRVSNDNPFSERQFETARYQPDYPGKFIDIAHGRQWCEQYVDWYNFSHHHSSPTGFTPEQVFTDEYEELAKLRQQALTAQFASHLERFVNEHPQAAMPPSSAVTNPIQYGDEHEQAATAVNFSTLSADREAALKYILTFELSVRKRLTRSGGVISPLLANLFLHYGFDQWIERTHRFTPFERYADDIVCHCTRMSDAVRLKESVASRFAELGLTINESKSKVVYIDTFERRNVATSFTFLGYDFKVRTLKNYKGEVYRKCMPGASMKAMKRITKTIKEWRIHRSTADSIKAFSDRHNATLRGWIEYYGKFWYRNFGYRLWSVMQSRLIKWAKRKFRLSTRQAQWRLDQLRKKRPKLFAHWYLLRASNV